MINQTLQSQAGLQTSFQHHQQGRACPCHSSQAAGQARWLRVAQSHEPRCRRATGENKPVPRSLQPQGHLALSRGSMNLRAGGIHPLPRVTGPGYAPARPFPRPAVLEALLPCTGLVPKQDSVPGGPGGCRARLCRIWVSPHPQSAGQGGAEPRGALARRQTCSGQTGGGARAGEAEIRASLRELWRHSAAGNGRKGLPEGCGGVACLRPSSLTTCHCP